MADPVTYEALRDAILTHLDRLTVARTAIPDYRATIAQVAAHIVAAEATTKRRVAMSAKPVAERTAKAERLARMLVRAIRTGADPIDLTEFDGPRKTFRRIENGMIRCGGWIAHISPELDGVHRRLPVIVRDPVREDPMVRQALRDELIAPRVIAGTTVRIDEEGTLHFSMPAPDGDADMMLHDHILAIAHKTDGWLAKSLRHFAAKTALRDRNYAQAKTLLSRIRAEMDEMLADDPGMTVARYVLYSAHPDKQSRFSEGARGVDFIIHVHIGLLGDALTRITDRIVLSDYRTPRSPDKAEELARLIKRHRANVKAAKRIDRIQIEHVAHNLLTDAGVDIATLLTRLAAAPRRTSIPGTQQAWARIDAGRMTITMNMAPGVEWKRDRVRIARTTLPQSVLTGLTGLAADLLIDHPALRGATIVRAKQDGTAVEAVIHKHWRTP